MRHIPDPHEGYEPDPDFVPDPEDPDLAGGGSDIWWPGPDPDPDSWYDEQQWEVEVARFITRNRRHLRRLGRLAWCPKGGRQLAGLYAYEDDVWLWLEGTREQWGTEHRTGPPRAVPLRPVRTRAHARGAGCGCPVDDYMATCPCCHATWGIRHWCHDTIEVIPLPLGHNAI